METGAFMRLFAVILASIAAIAATAQTYFIWSGKGAAPAISYNEPAAYRQSACRTVVSASASYFRLAREADRIVEQSAAAHRAQELKYVDEDEADMTAIEKEALEEGRETLMRLADDQIYALKNFVDVEYLYFSDAELEKVGFETWSALIDHYGFLTSYVSDLKPSESEFTDFVASLGAAGALNDQIKSVCAPVLLDEA